MQEIINQQLIFVKKYYSLFIWPKEILSVKALT